MVAPSHTTYEIKRDDKPDSVVEWPFLFAVYPERIRRATFPCEVTPSLTGTFPA